jgi:hypothetical protein
MLLNRYRNFTLSFEKHSPIGGINREMPGGLKLGAAEPMRHR